MYLKWCLNPQTFFCVNYNRWQYGELRIHYRLLYYKNALCLFFSSYWIHLLLMCLHEWNFPEFVSFFYHNIWPARNKWETLPRMNHLLCSFIFLLSYFPMSYMQSCRSKMSSICCPLSIIQWSPLLHDVVEYTTNA